MLGTAQLPLIQSIHVDKVKFSSKRKYNRERLLNGDQTPLSEGSETEVENGQGMDRPDHAYKKT